MALHPAEHGVMGIAEEAEACEVDPGDRERPASIVNCKQMVLNSKEAHCRVEILKD